ncbi:unnamed protein product [Protopolystoma xenopodis]|uniref:Uncharacterized protein n=1 Tax=Protopolystoma xenopodis TaxID=117903 RepID=A0A3S5FDY8_9PLAT|nr:unnamed protein product [Protopolystoma xenopodis]
MSAQKRTTCALPASLGNWSSMNDQELVSSLDSGSMWWWPFDRAEAKLCSCPTPSSFLLSTPKPPLMFFPSPFARSSSAVDFFLSKM